MSSGVLHSLHLFYVLFPLCDTKDVRRKREVVTWEVSEVVAAQVEQAPTQRRHQRVMRATLGMHDQRLLAGMSTGQAISTTRS
nr:hypothetical protein CFP56_22267 [Quercus suber]